MKEPRIERIGDAVLYLGDCYTILPTLPPAGAVVTDPPYGVNWDTGYDFNPGSSEPSAKKMIRKKHKPIAGDDRPFDPAILLGNWISVIFGANYFSHKLPAGAWLIWDKRRPDDTFFMSPFEMAWSSHKGRKIQMVRHCWQGFARASENSAHYHPTQKPVAVMSAFMDMAKIDQGAIVLDPFMGSGSTGVACAATGRKFIGVEVEPTYFETACERIAAAYAQRRLFA